MKSTEFRVMPYSIDVLRSQIATCAVTDVECVQAKMHDGYLDGYLSYMDAKCLIVESPYVDRDYLEDHAAYYVRCFRDYARFCTRLHFFTQAFTSQEVDLLLSGYENDTLKSDMQTAYLGFVVIRPLPVRFIGRTCLKLYPNGQACLTSTILSIQRQLSLLLSSRAGSAFLAVASCRFPERKSLPFAAVSRGAVWRYSRRPGSLWPAPCGSWAG